MSDSIDSTIDLEKIEQERLEEAREYKRLSEAAREQERLEEAREYERLSKAAREQERFTEEAREYERLSEATREYTKFTEDAIKPDKIVRPVNQITVVNSTPTKTAVKQKIMSLPTHLVFRNFKK